MTDARIIDQGYRRYDGPRRSTGGAIVTLARHSALRALGLRRSVWAKLLPIPAVVIAYLPAAVFVGIAALVPEELLREVDAIGSYSNYYGFISAAIALFVAVVGPEVLCPDRRNGMLGLYLASPLSRDSYLVAKALAVLPVLLLVTLGPPLLLLDGWTMVDAGPEGTLGFVTVFGRIVVGAVIVAVPYTALSLAVASLTDRRAFASAGIIFVLFATAISTATLVETAGADERVLLLNLLLVPYELVIRLYGEIPDNPELTTASLVLAEVAWVVGLTALLRWRYQRLKVTR